MTYEALKAMLKMFVDSEIKTRSEQYRRQAAELLRQLADDIDPVNRGDGKGSNAEETD